MRGVHIYIYIYIYIYINELEGIHMYIDVSIFISNYFIYLYMGAHFYACV